MSVCVCVCGGGGGRGGDTCSVGDGVVCRLNISKKVENLGKS